MAADLSLVAGEYAAHEGGERALFAVIEGRIEPVKHVDGIERIVGERRPGEIFGEVPIALGTVFPAALFFSTHARSVTILCRGDSLAKSMSRYLVDQLAARPNIRMLFGSEVAAVHGDASLQAIDVRDSATAETTRLESGGLFIFIGADAQTAWLPPEIAVDDRGYVLTGSDMRATGRWMLDRDPVPP